MVAQGAAVMAACGVQGAPFQVASKVWLLHVVVKRALKHTVRVALCGQSVAVCGHKVCSAVSGAVTACQYSVQPSQALTVSVSLIWSGGMSSYWWSRLRGGIQKPDFGL